MSEPLSEEWFEEREKRLLDSWQDGGKPDHNLAVLRAVAAEAMREAARIKPRLPRWADVAPGCVSEPGEGWKSGVRATRRAILRRAEEIEGGTT